MRQQNTQMKIFSQKKKKSVKKMPLAFLLCSLSGGALRCRCKSVRAIAPPFSIKRAEYFVRAAVVRRCRILIVACVAISSAFRVISYRFSLYPIPKAMDSTARSAYSHKIVFG